MNEGPNRAPDADAQQTSRWVARAVLPVDHRAPQAARRLVSTLLVAWGSTDQVELAELMVSELVSNAVKHAADAGDLELEVAIGPHGIQLSVADGSARRPTLLEPSVGQEGGMGLNLVDRVATRWGVEDHLMGKRIWVELARPSP